MRDLVQLQFLCTGTLWYIKLYTVTRHLVPTSYSLGNTKLLTSQGVYVGPDGPSRTDRTS
jgi:hypothetical protein